jgi:DNA-binding PadR family transcriptional regulator
MPAGSVSFRHFVLGLLNQQPMSGYDIKRLLKGLGWLVDGPSFGNIYPTLHALLKDGLVTVEVVPHQNKPPRKIYSVTETGRQILQEWANRPVTPSPSLRAFVMRLILAGSFSQARLVAHLQQRRNQVTAHQATLEQTAEALDEEADLQRLALDYGLALAITELAWLDSTLNRLSQQPLPMEVVKSN